MPKKVPYLYEEQIERDVAALLAEYAQARDVAIKPPIPVEDIVEKHLKLGIEFDDMHRWLNHPRSGLGLDPDILGAIFFDERRIVIDESSIRRKTRLKKAAIGLRWRTKAAGIGGCIVICSPRTRRKLLCSAVRRRRPLSAVPVRPRSRWSGRRISMRRAF
jgi:hypothetical protein